MGRVSPVATVIMGIPCHGMLPSVAPNHADEKSNNQEEKEYPYDEKKQKEACYSHHTNEGCTKKNSYHNLRKVLAEQCPVE